MRSGPDVAVVASAISSRAYKAELIEDESYYWTISRYIHLNPVRAGLVERPQRWPWSSYPGYHNDRQRVP
jgi:hypothetical protein